MNDNKNERHSPKDIVSDQAVLQKYMPIWEQDMDAAEYMSEVLGSINRIASDIERAEHDGSGTFMGENRELRAAKTSLIAKYNELGKQFNIEFE